MAVEIKELVIRAVATPSQDTMSQGGGASSGLDQGQVDALVETCVQEVLKILERKESR